MGTRHQAPSKVLTAIIQQKHTTAAKVTKQEGFIEQREVTMTIKDTRVMKVTNRPTIIFMGKEVIQEKRNMSRNQRRKAVKRNLTTMRVRTGQSMTSMKMGDTEPSIRNTTSTRKRDSPRYGICIPYSVLRAVHILFQSGVFSKCHLVFPLTIFIILSFS
jgi:ribosomal protein S8